MCTILPLQPIPTKTPARTGRYLDSLNLSQRETIIAPRTILEQKCYANTCTKNADHNDICDFRLTTTVEAVINPRNERANNQQWNAHIVQSKPCVKAKNWNLTCRITGQCWRNGMKEYEKQKKVLGKELLQRRKRKRPLFPDIGYDCRVETKTMQLERQTQRSLKNSKLSYIEFLFLVGQGTSISLRPNNTKGNCLVKGSRG